MGGLWSKLNLGPKLRIILEYGEFRKSSNSLNKNVCCAEISLLQFRKFELDKKSKIFP